MTARCELHFKSYNIAATAPTATTATKSSSSSSAAAAAATITGRAITLQQRPSDVVRP